MVNLDLIVNELKTINTTIKFEEVYLLIKALLDNNYSIKDIDNLCPKLNNYKIINYILTYGNNDINDLKAIKDYYNSLNIESNKCVLIADNHLGRLDFNEHSNKYYKNEKGLCSAYNHAIKNNIKNIINLGDLIEGDSDKSMNRMYLDNQIKYLEFILKHTCGVKTYLLYGNHDYNAIYHNGLDDKFYKVCDNTELVGVNKSFINFNGYRLKLSHYCHKAEDIFQNIELDSELELSGHSHTYQVYEDIRLVKVPSLSSVSPDKDGIGYLEMIDEGNEFLFKFFNDDGKEISSKEKTLLKRNNTNIC